MMSNKEVKNHMYIHMVLTMIGLWIAAVVALASVLITGDKNFAEFVVRAASFASFTVLIYYWQATRRLPK